MGAARHSSCMAHEASTRYAPGCHKAKGLPAGYRKAKRLPAGYRKAKTMTNPGCHKAKTIATGVPQGH